ncbi:hypothetical protein J1605_000796 [Eschrichtius robustus]|uniref:Uncharacterized protein n=1 Tax=Eschrichtius robustus TaxID=9764 RepID=A0AB34GL17_ESCRO|nr:hypothetical protein J1605_000796 [Eschrichtius robustus]
MAVGSVGLQRRHGKVKVLQASTSKALAARHDPLGNEGADHCPARHWPLDRPRTETLRALGLSALCLSLYSSGGWGSDLFSFPGERVTAAAGPPASPQVHQAQGLWQLPACFPASHCCWLCSSGPWLPGAGAMFQRPGIRQQEALWLPPVYVQSVLEELRGPVPSAPGEEEALPSAPGQTHRHGSDGTCDHGSWALSAYQGGALSNPNPTQARVSSSCATGRALSPDQ